jgi:CheY-like chemotaxis protein
MQSMTRGVGLSELRRAFDPPVAVSDAGLLTESRVVIVDDNSANVRVLQRLLEDAGLDGAEGFTDGRRALDRCLDSPPDLLLLDLRMPGLDGFAVLQALQSALPSDAFLPVLVLTGDDSVETKEQALAAGAKDFLAKPFDAVEVVLRVRNLLETKDLYTRLQLAHAQLQA